MINWRLCNTRGRTGDGPVPKAAVSLPPKSGDLTGNLYYQNTIRNKF